MAPERGYGKYTSNMADDLWLQVHVHKDELQRWLKARSLKTTTENKNLSTVWLKRRKVEMRLKKEKRERKRFEKLELLRNFQFVNFEQLDKRSVETAKDKS